MRSLAKTLAPVAISVAMLALCSCKQKKDAPQYEPPVRPVKMMTVNSTSDVFLREYPGKVRANQRVKLAFQVTGQIISFPVKCGDRIKAGQILAELDPRDFENALKSASATYEEAKADFGRQSRLVEKSAVSTATVESKKMSYEIAEAAMKTAAKALADTKLKAPFDGIVAGAYVDNFQNIQAHAPVLSLQDISQVEIVSNVPEKDVIRANVEATREEANSKYSFIVQFPALGDREFPVRLKEFETEADSATQTFKTVVAMPTPEDINIMPGMTAMLKVRKNGKAAGDLGFWVPSAAVMEDSSGLKCVWVVDSSMKVVKRAVGVAGLSGENIFITNGLSTGERIATAGTARLAEGMKVKELKSIDGRKIPVQSGNGK